MYIHTYIKSYHCKYNDTPDMHRYPRKAIFGESKNASELLSGSIPMRSLLPITEEQSYTHAVAYTRIIYQHEGIKQLGIFTR